MKNKTLKTIVLFIFLLLALSGCSSELVNQGTPDPCYLPLPEPTSGNAVVSGKLVSTSKNLLSEKTFYLLRNSTDGQSNLPPVMVLSFTSSPRAVMNECGNFLFKDVEPATYAMALWEPNKDPTFIMIEDNQDYLWVYAEAGKSIDMGQIDVP